MSIGQPVTDNLPFAGVRRIGAPVLYVVELMHLELVSFLQHVEVLWQRRHACQYI